MLTITPRIALLSGFVGLSCLGGAIALADEAAEYAALAKALPSAKVKLQQGLAASESTGRPISAKFEVEDGHLQLSVYTAKSTGFQEVVINHTTGAVSKAETISEADDLKAANAQAAAMAHAKSSLKAAVDAAEKALPGFRAVSVTPTLKDRHAVAEVTLLKESAVKSVTESLE